jgi:Flp pilus assembly protein TadG
MLGMPIYSNSLHHSYNVLTSIFTLFSLIYGFLSKSVYRTYMSEGGKQLENRLGQRGLTRFGGFGRNSSGATALEFAMVAGPFLLLLFGILGVGLVFLANMTLENAVAQGARLIRTGEAQSQGFDAAKFKTEVCKYLTAPLSCGGLKLDVSSGPTFAGSDLTNPLDSSGNLKSEFNYAPGVGGQVVRVQAFYEWDRLATLPQALRLSNMQNGNLLLKATQAFRNEPFK